jgi:hypothetical protein
MSNALKSGGLSRRSVLTGFGSLLLASVGFGHRKLKAAKWDDKYELLVEVEIAEQGGGRVHRPYVAIWIEDASGKAVRTLNLWVQTSRRGPRWIPDLRRWYRAEQDRKTAKGGDLVETASSATRSPGKYSMVWNGKDDQGKAVDQGDYVICIEAAREHGTYQLIKKSISVGTKTFKQSFDGNIEIKSAGVEFRKRSK